MSSGVGGGGLWPGAEITGGYYRHVGGWGGGHDQHNEKKLLISRNRMLSEENHGLCFNTEQMAKRIRSQTEDMRGMRFQLEKAVKDKFMIKKLADAAQDELVALKSESSRRYMEYEAQISRIKDTEKKWRLKVQKMKKQSFSQTLEEIKDIPVEKKTGVNKEENEELSINEEEGVNKEESNELEQSDEKEENKEMKEAETIPAIKKFKFKHLEENNGQGTSKMVTSKRDTKRSSRDKLSQRQKQINFLESRIKLSNFEIIKLSNLKEQEDLWHRLEEESSVCEAKLNTKKNEGVFESVEDGQETEAVPHPHDSAENVTTCEEVLEDGPEFLTEKYLDPDHLKQLKSLPLRTDPIFVNVPGSIPISKNRQLSILLHSGKDPEKLIKLINATPEEYTIITGRSVEDVVVTDGRVDSIDDLGIHTKSLSWIKQIGGVYNKVTTFAEDNPEFRYFFFKLIN